MSRKTSKTFSPNIAAQYSDVITYAPSEVPHAEVNIFCQLNAAAAFDAAVTGIKVQMSLDGTVWIDKAQGSVAAGTPELVHVGAFGHCSQPIHVRVKCPIFTAGTLGLVLTV